MVSFLTWSLTIAATLLITSVLTVFISVAPESAGDTLSISAFHQTLAVTRAIDLVGLIHTVMVTVTHPLYGDAAPVSTAMLFCGIAITVLLVTQIPTVIISITYKAVIKALARVTVKQILTAIAMGLVTPVVTVIVAVTLQFPGDADATGTQKALTPSTEHEFHPVGVTV